jgi:hypothetical protein
LTEAKEVRVELSTISTYAMGNHPYEGLMRVQKFELEKEEWMLTFNPGSVRFVTNQPLGELAVILLELESLHSFFRWSFNTIFTKTEYMETYIMEPLIAKMLLADGNLKAKFEAKKSAEADFAKSPRAIYQWFYAQTPYFDQNWKVIPVGREW